MKMAKRKATKKNSRKKKTVKKKPTTKKKRTKSKVAKTKKSPKKTVSKKTKLSPRTLCELSPKVQTHIKGFDKLINGGFRRNSINLVAGNAGTGKTIFAAEFLIHGALKNKEPCIYITFEEKKEKFYKDMACLGYDLQKLEDANLFVYLEYTPEQVRNVLIEGGGIIDSIIEKIKATRLVIDSITSFSLLYDDELSKKEAALSLFELINKWGCTALLTSQNEAEKEGYVKVSLEFEVDSVILMYNLRVKGKRKRGLEVLKMRGTAHSPKTYELTISKKGLVIHTSKIIKELSII